MKNRASKLTHNVIASIASLWIATSSSLVFADGYVIADNTIRTITGPGTLLYTINADTDKKVVTAKVIVENLSNGPRSVQCQLQIGQTWIDYANATMGAGEAQTLTMMIHKSTTTFGGGNLNCKVFSALKDGVSAAWVKVHFESGT